MTYQIKILERAESEAREIFAWIEERSPDGAQRWLAAFDDAANRLRSNPCCWPLAPENKLVEYEVRNFVFKTRRGKKYRVLDTVVEDEVRILHVRGSRQDIMDQLGPPDDVSSP